MDESEGRPGILLMLQEGVPEDFEAQVRAELDLSGIDLRIVRIPGGPYAGLELYLPTAVALFIAAGFFNGMLQEAGKDAYSALRAAAVGLWKRAAGLNITVIGAAGKLSSPPKFSATFSLAGEVIPGLKFKFLIKTDVTANDAEAGIHAFIQLVDDLLNDRIGEEDMAALLTYKPIGGTVLVTFDAEAGKIVPVDAFAGKRPPAA